MAYALYDEFGQAIGGTNREVKTVPISVGSTVIWQPPPEEEMDAKRGGGKVLAKPAPPQNPNAPNLGDQFLAGLRGGPVLPGSQYANSMLQGTGTGLRYIGNELRPQVLPNTMTGYERWGYTPNEYARYNWPSNYPVSAYPQGYGAYGNIPQTRSDLTGSFLPQPQPFWRFFGGQYPGRNSVPGNWGAYSYYPEWTRGKTPRDFRAARMERESGQVRFAKESKGLDRFYNEKQNGPEPGGIEEMLKSGQGGNMKFTGKGWKKDANGNWVMDRTDLPESPQWYQDANGNWIQRSPKVVWFEENGRVPQPLTPPKPVGYGSYYPRYGGGGGGGWGGGYGGYGGYGSNTNAWLQGLMNWNIG